MRRFACLAVLGAATLLLLPGAATARTCSDHQSQADAQRAKDTRDADSDGIYCESNPCPCLKPGQGGKAKPKAKARPKRKARPSCVRPARVQRIRFSARKYPHIRSHVEDAVRLGWPRTLVLNRPGADDRRDKLLGRFPSPPEFHDRDEYPPAVGRGRGRGLERGTSPRGWKADVRVLPSSENRSHGAALGNALRPFCNGTKFRYVFD